MNDLVTPIDPVTDPAALAGRLREESAPDIVEALNDQRPAVAAAVLLGLTAERAVEVLDQPGLDAVVEIVEALPRDRAGPLLAGMAADRLADLFRLMAEPGRSDLLERLDPETQGTVRALLAYPEESAGSIMTTEFVSVPGSWSVGQTLDHIRQVERTRETVYSVYVLDAPSGVLLAALPLRRLISAEASAPVLSVAAQKKRPVTISALANRDDAARLISKYDLLAVPVVDGAGHLIGIVTVDDVIDAMNLAQGGERSAPTAPDRDNPNSQAPPLQIRPRAASSLRRASGISARSPAAAWSRSCGASRGSR